MAGNGQIDSYELIKRFHVAVVAVVAVVVVFVVVFLRYFFELVSISRRNIFGRSLCLDWSRVLRGRAKFISTRLNRI